VLFKKGIYLLFDDEQIRIVQVVPPVAPTPGLFTERGLWRGTKQGVVRGV